MKAIFHTLCLTMALSLPALSREADNPDHRGTATVIDGDTIEIHGTRIRLNGIDAPESAQPCRDARGKTWRCGQQAALALSDRTYSTAYVDAEEGARSAGRGIWQGRFEMPWDWRAGRRGAPTPAPLSRLLELAGRDWSCSPRKTCPAIGSCEEANWYLQNCAWGGKLDRDNDGIPCESLC